MVGWGKVEWVEAVVEAVVEGLEALVDLEGSVYVQTAATRFPTKGVSPAGR